MPPQALAPGVPRGAAAAELTEAQRLEHLLDSEEWSGVGNDELDAHLEDLYMDGLEELEERASGAGGEGLGLGATGDSGEVGSSGSSRCDRVPPAPSLKAASCP